MIRLCQRWQKRRVRRGLPWECGRSRAAGPSDTTALTQPAAPAAQSMGRLGLPRPGAPIDKNHRPLPGETLCSGRCRTDFRHCPLANSTFEEVIVANTERISEIEIVGFGPQYWNASQTRRPSAMPHAMQKIRSFRNGLWPVLTLLWTCVMMVQQRHIHCDAAIATARQKYTSIGDEAAAAAAACAQLDAPSVGGLRMQRNLFDENNVRTIDVFTLVGLFLIFGSLLRTQVCIYTMIGLHEGWPHFQALNGSQHLFHRPFDYERGPEWVFSKYFDPTGDSVNGRIPCDGGPIPLGVQHRIG